MYHPPCKLKNWHSAPCFLGRDASIRELVLARDVSVRLCVFFSLHTRSCVKMSIKKNTFCDLCFEKIYLAKFTMRVISRTWCYPILYMAWRIAARKKGTYCCTRWERDLSTYDIKLILIMISIPTGFAGIYAKVSSTSLLIIKQTIFYHS